MRVRRCHQLVVELDQAPRFSFASLLEGGDGMDRSVRWLAYAPQLAAAEPVTLEQLAVLQATSCEDWVDQAQLCERHDAAIVDSLLAVGLLLAEHGQEQAAWRARDQTARDIAWWPLALVAHAHGGWGEVDIQARNERGLMMSSEQIVEAFGAAPEPSYRRVPAVAPLPLAAPVQSDFDALLAARRTCRNFDGEAVLGRAEFATMMRRVWGAVGTRELAPGAVAVKKNSPAGGGLHAVEAYVLVQRVEGLAPGIYHYLSMDHALEPMRMLSADEAAGLAHRFVAGQDWFNNAPAMVVMTARFDRLFWKYRRHTKAWRVVHLDVGHLSQTMYLSATDLGLGCFVTAAISDRAVEEALDLPALREGPIAIVGFGRRSGEIRTMELDQLVPVQPAHLAPSV
ncbi:MAG: putative peptide maturation dehydrogenase [Arenimonas sp.]|uniref:putative peptide maturation dehydrogenase n=1 Tax=Arenimonas sp. TaxID=1872635 RepID=UPI0025BCC1EA|nr:putative peptide maturation dehydrogenase [Arenimonas sp.]MBW8368899.1 putative peptide maturation dehydrogenase [Arenimonas sp.]